MATHRRYKEIQTHHTVQSQVETDQRPGVKTMYIEPDRREGRNSFELFDTRKDFLKILSFAQALRSKLISGTP